MLNNTPNQSSKFKTKYWVEISDELRGTYNKDNKNRFKTSLFRSSLCDYSDSHIFIKGTITVRNIPGQVQPNNAAKKSNI